MKANNEIAERVLGFFVSKGLLVAPNVLPMPMAKLSIDEVLQFGFDTEPRVIEVLPAALIHFPRSFINHENLPPELNEIIAGIKRGDTTGSDFRGISWRSMRRWAQKTLNDKRTVALSEQRIMRSFRLRPRTVAQLKATAQRENRTETEIIEMLITKMS